MARKSLATAVSTELASRAIDAQRQRIISMTTRFELRVFKVEAPVTVFIRGTRCRVHVHYHDLDQVELHTKLYNAFGLLFVTEQDDAGVYVVIKRRRFLGWISRAEFLIKVPRYAHLAFNLTPGTILLEEIQGIAEISPIKQQIKPSIQQISDGNVK